MRAAPNSCARCGPVPVAWVRGARYDPDVAPGGIGNLFRTDEPGAGRRWVMVTAQRTTADLDRRVVDRATWERAIVARQHRRHANPTPVAWRFTTDHARITLRRLSPSIQE